MSKFYPEWRPRSSHSFGLALEPLKGQTHISTGETQQEMRVSLEFRRFMTRQRWKYARAWFKLLTKPSPRNSDLNIFWSKR